MENVRCPFCKKKSAYFRASVNNWRCGFCEKTFLQGDMYVQDLNGKSTDEYGNIFDKKIETFSGTIIETTKYYLPFGKKTLKGMYPKIDESCIKIERDCCGAGIGFDKCENLFYDKGNWKCKLKSLSLS